MALLDMWSYDLHTAFADFQAHGWIDTNAVGFVASGIDSGGGRNGSNCLYWSRGTGGSAGAFSINCPSSNTTWIWGAFVKIRGGASSFNSCPIVGFGENATTPQRHVELIYLGDADGHIQVQRSGTALVTTSGHPLLIGNSSFYLECKWTCADSGGTVEVRINGLVVASFTGDTRNGGTGQPTFVHHGFYSGSNQSSCGISVEDEYLLDGSGGAPWNDYLGDVRVVARNANGNGSTNNFTPSAGSNYQNVDETAPNGDTDYNSSGTVSDIDLYDLADLPSTPVAIHGVKISADVRKDDVNFRTGRTVVRTHATNYEGSSQAVLDAYTYMRTIYQTNPNTAAAWTQAEVDALQAGVKVQA